MGSQRFGIADIHQAQEELQCVNELRAGFTTAFNTKTQQTGGFAAVVSVNQGFIRTVGQGRIVHPFDLRMFL